MLKKYKPTYPFRGHEKFEKLTRQVRYDNKSQVIT